MGTYAIDTAEFIDETIDKYRRYVNPGLANIMDFVGFHGVEWSGEGRIVRDPGVEYLDFLGGYGVFALGHAHPAVVHAVREQLARMPLSSRVLFNRPMADLAERLPRSPRASCNITFFCNSGTEAVEGA